MCSGKDRLGGGGVIAVGTVSESEVAFAGVVVTVEAGENMDSFAGWFEGGDAKVTEGELSLPVAFEEEGGGAMKPGGGFAMPAFVFETSGVGAPPDMKPGGGFEMPGFAGEISGFDVAVANPGGGLVIPGVAGPSNPPFSKSSTARSASPPVSRNARIA
jgi:hypothetical protein